MRRSVPSRMTEQRTLSAPDPRTSRLPPLQNPVFLVPRWQVSQGDAILKVVERTC